MKHRGLRYLSVLAIVAATGPVSAAGIFQPLPLDHSFFPNAVRVSNDGSALCGWNNFYWTEATGYLFPASGQVANVSGDGQICVGELQVDGVGVAATWVPGGDWTPLAAMPGGESCDAFFSSGDALDTDGDVAVGLAWVPGCRAEAFRWTEDGGTTGLGRSAPSSSRAYDVSGDGSVIVGWDEHPDFGYRRPALWQEGVSGPQHFVGEEPAGEASGVSTDGQRICGTKDGFAFYYDQNAGLIDIGALPGETWGSTATGVADDGTVVGFSGDPFFSFPAAFIWTQQGGIQKLQERLVALGVDVAGYYLYTATSVSADGRVIAGCAIDPSGFWFVPYVVRLPYSVGAATSGIADAGGVKLELTAAPNPFSSATRIGFALPQAAPVELSVIDLSGRTVRVLSQGVQPAGAVSAEWDGTDATGRRVAAGTYFVRLSGAGQTVTQKVSMIR